MSSYTQYQPSHKIKQGIDSRYVHNTSSVFCQSANTESSQKAGMYSYTTFTPNLVPDDYTGQLLFNPHATNNFKEQSKRPETTNYGDNRTLEMNVRPYVGFFCGAGMGSTNASDFSTESIIRQGVTTSLPCMGRDASTADITGFNFNCLPAYGNPQQVKYIIPPSVANGGWVRGGENTRDYVRRQRCACK